MEENFRYDSQSQFARLKSSFKKFIDSINERVENFGIQYIAFGIFGILNYPIYYFIWLHLAHQSYESFSLRLTATLLCLLLLLKNYWPEKLKYWFPIYWLVTLCFCLPFFFFFMTLKNQGETVWLMAANTIVFWMILMVDWVIYIFIFFVGISAAIVCYYLTSNEPINFGMYKGVIAELIGSFIVVAFFAENKLRLEKEKLQVMKTLAATIAHELRTPLGAIQAGVVGIKNYFPGLLKGYRFAKSHGANVEEIRSDHLEILPEILDNIGLSANQANIIVEMLLTNIKYPSVKIEKLETFTVFECVEYALSNYSFLPNQKEKIQVDYMSNHDFQIKGNKLLIVHVMYNLIKNALYFIEKAGKGSISVWIDNSHSKYYELHFKDTGHGIAKEDLPYIFDRFFTKGTHRGSGIGLAFCKMVMDAHGGKIACHSIKGEYAEFVLSFPKS